MVHYPLTSTLLAGDLAELRLQLKANRFGWGAPQPPGHPLWALVDAMAQRHPPSGVPWKAIVEAFQEAGCPPDPQMHLAESTWKSKKPQARVTFVAGTSIGSRAEQGPAASLLSRAVHLRCTPMVAALLDQGADPVQEQVRVHLNRMDSREAAWHAVQEDTPAEIIALLAAHTTKALPATPETVEWVGREGGNWAPEHPVWALLPSMEEPLWAWICVRQTSHTGGRAAWWVARPQDREGLIEAAVRRERAGEHTDLARYVVAACARPGQEALLDEAVGREGALTRLSLRLDARGYKEYLAVPPLQWIRHLPAPMFSPETARAGLLSRMEASMPNWGASSGAALTEGELAILARLSPLNGDDHEAVWQAHPEWRAPHAQTGRTPLWHAHTEEEADRWWRRGCSLADVDAEGNQVMALLTARAMKLGRDGAGLANWLRLRLKDGIAPLHGQAWGQPLQEWVQGRQDLATAWGKRSGGDVASPSGGLWVQGLRLNLRAVEKILACGVSPGVRDSGGRTLVEALLDVPRPSGKAVDRRWPLIRSLLKAGAPYVLSDGRPLLAHCVAGWKDKKWPYRDWLDRAIGEHHRQGAPWTPLLAWKTLGACRSIHSLREPWTNIPLPVRRAWLDYLFDPAQMPSSDLALADRLKMLHELLPQALRDSTWEPGTSQLAAWQAALNQSRPLLQKQWDQWQQLPADTRSLWAAWMMEGAVKTEPASAEGRPHRVRF